MGGSRSYRRRVLLVVCYCLFFAAVLGLPVRAHAITYGPTVKGLGPEQTVFDYSTEACATWDIPDQPARAFKDDMNRVQLHFSVDAPRRNIGTSLDTTTHECTVRSVSQGDIDPSHYDQYSWLSSPYTLDGHTIYALMHEEYRAWQVFPSPNQPRCNPPGGDTTKCWNNALTLETSTNSGDLFTHGSAPSHLVATAPYQWVDGTGPYGVFSPSNIIRKQPDDGYVYTIARAKEPGKSDVSCAMRTQATAQALGDPTSWRAWGDGPDADSTDSFEVQFVNPYTYSFTASDTPAKHMCKDVGGGVVTGVSESLTYNTFFQKYILVGAYGNPAPGFYYSLSDDLINWSAPKLLIGAETQHSWQCGDPDPIRDPSLLDPASTSRNFDTTGKQLYVYYKVLHVDQNCQFGPDRDQLRLPIEFQPAAANTPPSASFTRSPNPALTNQTVTFNGSASSDPDGTIANYKWDLDGNGTFETDTGTTATTSRSYASAATLTVKLRVTDNANAPNDTTRTLTINNAVNQAPTASFTIAPNPALAGQVVTLDGSASSDSDGAILKYEWDLDGNGIFETDTGAAPSASRAYASEGTLTLQLRVTDNNGAGKSLAKVLIISGQIPAPAPFPAPIQTPLAAVQTQNSTQASCAAARKKRVTRLTRQLRTARRKLARARTTVAKRRHRSQIKSLTTRLKRLRRSSCPR